MKLFKNISLSFILIVLLALGTRTLFLDRIPTGVSNDELDYLLNAKSVYLSGSDISHTWNPLSLTVPKSSFPQAEIAPLVTFWIVGPLPLSLFNSKLIYSLFSVGIVVLLYGITEELIGKKEAFVVGLVAAINPWLIFFGRTAYDTTLAVFFFLLALYILLLLRGWKILFAFPILMIAFYSYIGMKLLFIPYVLLVIAASWIRVKKDAFWYSLLVLGCVVLFCFYIFSVFHTPGTRVSELATPQMSSIVSTVNSERKLSIHTPLTAVLSNKYVVYSKYLMDKYFNAFSPDFLFLHGDEKSQFTLWNHGVFYILDAIFLLIGFAILFAKNKKVLLLLIGLITIAPIPSVMSTVGNSYAIRSMLLIIPFVICIGVGIWGTIKRYHFTSIPLILIYGMLFFNFVNIYFFQNPLYNSESFSFSGRVLSKYLSLTKGQVYIINGDPKTPFKEYLFYTNGLTKNTSNQVAAAYKDNNFSYNNRHFITCYQAENLPPNSTLIYDNGCKKFSFSKNNHAIAQLGDGGTIYTIRNDSICPTNILSYYPRDITFSDLNIERLSRGEFCRRFITRF